MTWTYAEVGATREGPLPPGYRHLDVRYPLRRPVADLPALGEALLTWRLHAAIGVPMLASARRAAPGVDAQARLGVGPLRLPSPCRVVWVEESGLSGGDRVAFGYGTLPGHVFSGEESFSIERDADGLWFAARAFSRPVRWWARAAGPLVPLGQRLYLRRLAAGARSLR